VTLDGARRLVERLPGLLVNVTDNQENRLVRHANALTPFRRHQIDAVFSLEIPECLEVVSRGEGSWFFRERDGERMMPAVCERDRVPLIGLDLLTPAQDETAEEILHRAGNSLGQTWYPLGATDRAAVASFGRVGSEGSQSIIAVWRGKGGAYWLRAEPAEGQFAAWEEFLLRIVH